MLRSALCILVLASTALAADDAPPLPLERLLKDLSSPEYLTRSRAVRACEGRTEPALLERLLALARNDPHPNVRGFAAQSMAGFDDPRIHDALMAMAQRESAGTLQDVYVALGKHGDERARPLLLGALKGERPGSAYAACGLGLLGVDADFAPVLEAYLAHLDDPYLHDLGVEALFRLDASKATTVLLPRFTDMPPAARQRLARALGAHPTPEATRALIGHLASADLGVRRAAVLGLGLAGRREATEPLVAYLRQHPKDVHATVRALGEIGDARALPALVALVGGESEAVTRVHAIEALARIGDRRAVAALVPCLEDHRAARQPRQISAVYGFPYNTRVDAAALWAIRRLRDGKEPFDVKVITRFPDPVLTPEVAAEIHRLQAWWKALEDRAPYRLGT